MEANLAASGARSPAALGSWSPGQRGPRCPPWGTCRATSPRAAGSWQLGLTAPARSGSPTVQPTWGPAPRAGAYWALAQSQVRGARSEAPCRSGVRGPEAGCVPASRRSLGGSENPVPARGGGSGTLSHSRKARDEPANVPPLCTGSSWGAPSGGATMALTAGPGESGRGSRAGTGGAGQGAGEERGARRRSLPTLQDGADSRPHFLLYPVLARRPLSRAPQPLSYAPPTPTSAAAGAERSRVAQSRKPTSAAPPGWGVTTYATPPASAPRREPIGGRERSGALRNVLHTSGRVGRAGRGESRRTMAGPARAPAEGRPGTRMEEGARAWRKWDAARGCGILRRGQRGGPGVRAGPVGLRPRLPGACRETVIFRGAA